MATGGGAHNAFLMEQITEYCKPIGDIHLPNENTINYKEAILMALMGLLRVENIPNCLSSVTGAQMDSVGGCIYMAGL